MKDQSDYFNINKQTWNNKTDVHIASDFYDNESFLNGKSTLNSIELELNLIGVCSGAMTFIQIINLLDLFWCELKIKYIEIFGLSFFV